MTEEILSGEEQTVEFQGEDESGQIIGNIASIAEGVLNAPHPDGDAGRGFLTGRKGKACSVM